MKGLLTKPSPLPRKPLFRAFTLVEVMVSMLILAMSTTGLTGLFLQNLRYSKWQTNNVQVANSTFGMADQIKNLGANGIWAAYQAAAAGAPIPLNVNTADPTDLTDGFRTTALNINQVATTLPTTSTTVVNNSWNVVTLRLGRNATDPAIPVSYWISIKRNASPANAAQLFDILEVTLIYKWSIGGKPTKTLNQIQLSFPAPNCSFNNFNP